MWHCMYKACPCVFTRKEYQTPFDNYYEDDDNVEFENLLADPDSIPARLSRSPFQRSNSQGYLRINSMVAPDEETSLSSGHFDTLLEDDEEDNIQTADAQFLPDEQINKISEQVKFNQFNQMTDEQLIAEEEEETRLQEEEYNKKRQAAKQAALAKGLMTSEQAVLESPNNKTTFFTIEDDENGDEEDDDDDNNEGKKLGGRNNTNNSNSSNNNSNGNSNFVELSSNTNNTTSANTNINKTSTLNDDDSSNKNSSSILNLPRNPHARLFAADVNFDDYEDETEFDEQCSNYDRRSPDSLFKRRHSRRSLAMMNDGIQKVDISSSLSFNIPTTQQSFDYDATIEEYSPSLDEDIEEVDHIFARILPDLSDKLGFFISKFTNNKNINNNKNIDNNNHNIENNNNSQEELNNINTNIDNIDDNNKTVTFTEEPEESSLINHFNNSTSSFTNNNQKVIHKRSKSKSNRKSLNTRLSSIFAPPSPQSSSFTPTTTSTNSSSSNTQ